MGLVFMIVACVLFILAGLGVALGTVALVPIGLAFLTLGFILGGISWPWPRPGG